jgi:hypothetical protein
MRRNRPSPCSFCQPTRMRRSGRSKSAGRSPHRCETTQRERHNEMVTVPAVVPGIGSDIPGCRSRGAWSVGAWLRGQPGCCRGGHCSWVVGEGEHQCDFLVAELSVVGTGGTTLRRQPEASIDGELDGAPIFGADPVIQLGTAVPSRLGCGGLDQARRYPPCCGPPVSPRDHGNQQSVELL